MCYGCPVGKNNSFPGGGTVELSLAGREAVSSENRGRIFQSGGRWERAFEFWLLPGVCGWFKVGPEDGKGGSQAVNSGCSVASAELPLRYVSRDKVRGIRKRK